MKIAIVGAGISGLTAAYLLNKKHDIHVFEKEDRLGGHTATIDIDYDGEQLAIDTGFIVYNDRTYPKFIKLLSEIGVVTQDTSMGFSVSGGCSSLNGSSGLEYAGNSINSLFAQRKNIFSPKFLLMLFEIVRFNKQAQSDLDRGVVSNTMTLGEYLKINKYSDYFTRNYLVPMGAAIWSASFAAMKAFPVEFFVRFFSNHGLLTVLNQPQWHVIQGGSKQYIAPLIKDFSEKITLNADIASVERVDEGSVKLIFADGHRETFDQVVFATHSDQALALLGDASEQERSVLSAIPYQDNSVVLHCDESLLPLNKRTWSSWNYLLAEHDDALPTLTYNMNILQGLTSKKTYCVTLNADEKIDKDKIIARFNYAHPQFSQATANAQQQWAEINGVNNTWFCGAYWGNGFHEDGVVSACNVAENLGVIF